MTKRGFDCGGCERHNTVDNMMLYEKCKKWYHYGCVGVTMMAKYWCNLCVMKVAKCEAQEMMGHLHPVAPRPKEAIAKTGMPAESCEGDRRAKRAAHSEGEASAKKHPQHSMLQESLLPQMHRYQRYVKGPNKRHWKS
ncbi:AGAP004897-PA [Anopheles gambiae str. PEST]|nr:AGAP004897-PA [Anopheles gambiae str. PEST]